jgi:hypothetical protein
MEKTAQQPLYSKGTEVRYSLPDLYDQTTGKIVEVERIFQDTFEDGSFDEDGLCRIESDMQSTRFPWEIKDNVLTIHYPPDPTCYRNGKIVVAKFKYFAYVCESSKMRTLFRETSIKPIKHG